MQGRHFVVKHGRLILLLVLLLGVGFAYALIPPMLEKPDEDGHYGYILYLREHRALPPLLFQPGLASEYKQPPLYYIVVALLTGWLPDEPVPERLLTTNPYADFSVPGHRNDNRNVFLHPPHVTPLFLGARVVSLFLGMGVVLLAYHFVRLLMPSDPSLAIATAAIVGFQPQFLYMATAVNNDIAITLLSTAAVTLLACRFANRLSGVVFRLLLGSVLGLAILTKASGIPLYLGAGAALLSANRGRWREAFREVGMVMAVGLLIGAWWYARNGILYGDPLTLHVHVTGYQERSRSLADIWNYDLPAIERTFWTNLSRLFVSPIPVDYALMWWGRVSTLLGGVAVLWPSQFPRSRAFLAILLLGWPGIYWLSLVGFWTARASWAYGRFLLPAIAPMALLFALGWRWVSRGLRAPLLFPLAVGILVVSGALIPLVSLYPLYHPSRVWQADRDEQTAPHIAFLDPGTGLPIARLVGFHLLTPYARPGTYVPVEICWEPLGRTSIPLPMFVHLLDLSPTASGNAPRIWGNRETYPGLGNYPTDRWPLHVSFCDKVLIWVFQDPPLPLCASVEPGFADPQTGERLQAVDHNGNPLALPIAGRIPILKDDPLPPEPDLPEYVLDGRIGLRRVESRVTPNSVNITLTWQALQTVPYDAVVFVHLTDREGNLLAQRDRPPLDGLFPTSCWLPGQVITDVVTLSPISLQNEEAVAVVGMYTWPSLQRLTVVNRSGIPVRDNAILLEVPSSERRWP